MSADDIFGPETDDERAQAEGHPLMAMLDRPAIPMFDFDKLMAIMRGEEPA